MMGAATEKLRDPKPVRTPVLFEVGMSLHTSEWQSSSWYNGF